MMGPAIILAAMGIGIGEAIMWPRMSAMWGPPVLSIGLFGITLQTFVTQEMGKWEMATGESFFYGAGRMWKYWWLAFFIAALFVYAWPTWLTVWGRAATEIIPLSADPKWSWTLWQWIGILLIAIFLSGFPVIYRGLETLTFITTMIAIICGAIIAIGVVSPGVVGSVLAGWVTPGPYPSEMWSPKFIGFVLGSIAYAGPSGMQQCWYTMWARDKKMGMGHYIGRITSWITGEEETIPATGFTFDWTNPEEMRKWEAWRRYGWWDAWVLHEVPTLLLTSLFAFLAVQAVTSAPEIMPVVRAGKKMKIIGAFADQARMVGGATMAGIFMFAVGLEAWDTALSVFDGFSRGEADMLYFFVPGAKKLPLRYWYYVFLYIWLALGSVVIFLVKPYVILVTGTSLAAIIMGLYCPTLAYMNFRMLPKEIARRNWIDWLALIFLLVGTVFYLGPSTYAALIKAKIIKPV